MDPIDVERAIGRPEAYYYEDGLGEIAGGIWGLAVTLVFLVEGLGLAPFKSFVAIFMMVWCTAGYWVGRTAVRAAKRRWVFPRTGEVRYRSPGASGWLVTLVGGGAGCCVLVLSMWLLRHDPMRQIWSDAGPSALLATVAISGLLLVVARDSGWRRRLVVLAGLALPFGVMAALSGLNTYLQGAILYGLASLALAGSGAIAFAGNLRHASVAECETDGR
jgi:hypothetical protein